ncbi:hypothetical protein ACLKA6_019785 [Drosophila palustris]
MNEWAPIVSTFQLAGRYLSCPGDIPANQPKSELVFIGIAPAATGAKLRIVHRSITPDLPPTDIYMCCSCAGNGDRQGHNDVATVDSDCDIDMDVDVDASSTAREGRLGFGLKLRTTSKKQKHKKILVNIKAKTTSGQSKLSKLDYLQVVVVQEDEEELPPDSYSRARTSKDAPRC